MRAPGSLRQEDHKLRAGGDYKKALCLRERDRDRNRLFFRAFGFFVPLVYV